MSHIETEKELLIRLHEVLSSMESALELHQLGVGILAGNFGGETIQAISEITATGLAMCDVARGNSELTPNDGIKEHPEFLGMIGRLTGAVVPIVVGLMADLEIR